MVPAAVLQGDREDVRDAVVQRLPRRGRVVLLRVVGTRADHVVGVVRRVDDDALDARRVRGLRMLAVQLARQVDPGLRLVLGGVLLRVRVEDRALRLAAAGKGDVVRSVRAVEQPGDHPVLALVDRSGTRLAAQRAVDGLDRHLAGEGGGMRLPAGDLALAGLPGGRGGVQRLADRLEDRLGREAQQGADAGGGRGAEMGDVVDLVAVQADRAREVDLDLVAGRDASDQIVTGQAVGASRVLGDGRDRRDVVAGMRVLGREKGVVVVELADRDSVGPRRPLRRHAGRRPLAEDGRAVLRMLRRLGQLLPAGARGSDARAPAIARRRRAAG